MIPASGFEAVFTDADGIEVRRAPVLAWTSDGAPMVPSVPEFRRLVWADRPAGYLDGVLVPGGRNASEVFARVERARSPGELVSAAVVADQLRLMLDMARDAGHFVELVGEYAAELAPPVPAEAETGETR